MIPILYVDIESKQLTVLLFFTFLIKSHLPLFWHDLCPSQQPSQRLLPTMIRELETSILWAP